MILRRPTSSTLLVLVFLAVTGPDLAAQGGRAGGCSFVENFENYSIFADEVEDLGVLALDDTTVTATGQGPGLVLDGVTYSCSAGSLRWNGDGASGLSSQSLNANSPDGDLVMDYDPPVTDVGFELRAYAGSPDRVVIEVFDSAGLLVHTSATISVPDQNPVPWSFQATDVGRVRIDGLDQDWSPTIDRHDYCDSGPGFSLTITGACPGPVLLEVANATPFGSVHVLYSQGSGLLTVPGGLPCAGLQLGLDPATATLAATLTADANGDASLPGNLPPAACGQVVVQAVDEASCTPSNPAGL